MLKKTLRAADHPTASVVKLEFWYSVTQNSVPCASPLGMANPRLRDWCFTVFDMQWFPHADVNRIYIVYQEEVAPDTGRHHFQGFVQFKKPYRMGQVKTSLGCEEAHLEPMRGSREQARAYCMKEESRAQGAHPIEEGEFKPSNARPDLKAKYEKYADPSCGLSQVIAEDPVFFATHYKALYEMRARNTKPRVLPEPPIVEVYTGPTGCGKSHRLFTEHPPGPGVFICDDENGFHTYDGEDIVLWDEFNPDIIQVRRLFRILDKWPISTRVLYAVKPIVASKFYLSSERHPSVWYPSADAHIQAQVMRRITTIHSFEDGQWIDPQ